MRTKYALWLGTVILIPTGCTNHSAKTAARSGPSHEEESEDRDEDEADEMTESGSTENPEQAESAAGVVEAAGPSTTLALNEVAVGALPDGWKVEATSQKGPLATWKVIDDASGPSKGHVLGLTSTNHDSGSTFNLCWTDKLRFKDGAIEASFKPISGKEDEGGGLIWRAKDKDDYYICRANPLESNFRVYFVKDGSRHQLASASAEIEAGQWHKLRVEHEHQRIVCFLDEKRLLDVTDSTFAEAGGVGFWTKSDAVSSFDGLKITAAGEGGEGKEGKH